MSKPCPFCAPDSQRIVAENDLAFALRDMHYPVSPGHTLICPKRHISSVFEISESEWAAVHTLLKLAKEAVEKEFSPDAYNIGINDGAAAGQSIPHLHIHLIPRYQGDVENPRGGVRWVLPAKAKYW